MRHNKPPSQLWSEATQEARDALHKLVGEIHTFWQASPHYSPATSIERLPVANLNWHGHGGKEIVSYSWSGGGVDVAITVDIHGEHPSFLLLGNEPLLYLLRGWLDISGPEGFKSHLTAQEMDRFDLRGHFETFDEKPAALNWAAKELYDFCLEIEEPLAFHGFEGWGFWNCSSAKKFLAWEEGKQPPVEFLNLDNVFRDELYPDWFKRVCSGGKYTYDVAGLIRFSDEVQGGHELQVGDVRLGKVDEFLLCQPQGSLSNMLGQAVVRLNRLKNLEFDIHVFKVYRAPALDALPIHYSSHDMASEMIDLGKYIAKIEWRLREERRALLARRFDNASKGRQRAANDARSADAKKRESIIASWMDKAELYPFRAKTTGRLKVSPLSKAIIDSNPFEGRVSGAIGQKQVERIIKRILKKDISPK